MARKRNGEVYVPVYTRRQREQDEKITDNAINNGKPVNWTAFKRLCISDICANTDIIESGYIRNIHIEDVQDALRHPKHRWKTLLEVSNALMLVSPYYYRLNMMFSNMALFCWGLDLYDVKDSTNKDTIKRAYNSLSVKLETMNLKHEFSKIMRFLPSQDIFCGLVVEDSTDFFFQRVDYRICKLCQIQDGLYNFKINLGLMNPKTLEAYPDYVQQAYLDYTEGKGRVWYSPPADKQICIKFNNQWLFPYPILVGLVGDILDLDTYKKLKLQSARTDNYKAIMVKVPIDESTVDKPLITPETLGIFAEINRESLSDDIGLIYNLGSDGEAINFKASTNTTNNVSDATEQMYDTAGVSSEIFNSSSTATAVKMALENSSAFVYHTYRQFERWINRFIKLRKYNRTNFKFSFYLLDETIFNRDDVTSRYKDSATLGLPVVDKYLASIDMTPSRVLGAYVTHNDIFDYYNKCKPLSSTYNSTQTSASEAGRPTNESQGEVLTDEGEKTSEEEKNIR